MGERTEDIRKSQYRCRFRCEKETAAADSHADGLRLFWDLPEGEEEADLLSVVQEQGVTRRFGFQESLQSLDSPFNLRHTSALML